MPKAAAAHCILVRCACMRLAAPVPVAVGHLGTKINMFGSAGALCGIGTMAKTASQRHDVRAGGTRSSGSGRLIDAAPRLRMSSSRIFSPDISSFAGAAIPRRAPHLAACAAKNGKAESKAGADSKDDATPDKPKKAKATKATKAAKAAKASKDDVSKDDIALSTTEIAEMVGASRAGKDKMRILFYSSQNYVVNAFEDEVHGSFPDSRFLPHRLDATTAALVEGERAVCIFVNDTCDKEVIDVLAARGVELIALRCAGFNNVDVEYAAMRGIKVVRVPKYSPSSIAEHAVALMLALNRWLPLAYGRVRQYNFTLSGLAGFEMRGKTVGVVGTGEIGQYTAKILLGFGMNVVASDPYPNQGLIDAGVRYMDLDDLIPLCDIISLHAPLMPSTFNMIHSQRISKMKDGVMIINTSRGGLIDTNALIDGLERGKIGAAGLDVYESEADFFFKDYSSLSRKEKLSARKKIWDRRFAELLSFPSVLVTPHSAFLTEEALANIAATTVASVQEFVGGKELECEVKPRQEHTGAHK